MNLKNLCLFFALIALCIPASAGLFTPEWFGEENSLHLDWTFDVEPNPNEPPFVDSSPINPFGSAQANITIGTESSSYGWVESYTSTGTLHTGFWSILGSIDVSADASTVNWEYSEIVVQVVFFQMGWGYYDDPADNPAEQTPDISVEGAQLISQTLESVETLLPNNAWILQTTIWRIEPSANNLQIAVNAGADGSLIDRLVVDAASLPEPATMIFLTAGAFLTRKNRHTC